MNIYLLLPINRALRKYSFIHSLHPLNPISSLMVWYIEGCSNLGIGVLTSGNPPGTMKRVEKYRRGRTPMGQIWTRNDQHGYIRNELAWICPKKCKLMNCEEEFEDFILRLMDLCILRLIRTGNIILSMNVELHVQESMDLCV